MVLPMLLPMLLPMAEAGPIRYAEVLVKKVSVRHCFGKVILRRLVSSGMRNPPKKCLTLLLDLAVACLPLQAFACNMDPGQKMDHSSMHRHLWRACAVHCPRVPAARS